MKKEYTSSLLNKRNAFETQFVKLNPHFDVNLKYA